MPYAAAIPEAEKAERDTMADHDPQDLTNARKVLVEMRYKLIKAIAAGDADLASSIMQRHTERTRKVYHDQRQAKSDSE